MPTLTFEPSGKTVVAESGSSLLDCARAASVDIGVPCGGKSTKTVGFDLTSDYTHNTLSAGALPPAWHANINGCGPCAVQQAGTTFGNNSFA